VIRGINKIIKVCFTQLSAHIFTALRGPGRVERPDYSDRTLSEPDVRNYRIRLPK